jgi:hypothetical protein
MTQRQWPDPLIAPNPEIVQRDLATFWTQLAQLADLIARRQLLLAHSALSELRQTVVALMLALNGIARPHATVALNAYLSASQRTALEKTLHLPTVDQESLIGQAVALTVIYRWYAPQLVDKFDLSYPHPQEQAAWVELVNHLPDWPQHVHTD